MVSKFVRIESTNLDNAEDQNVEFNYYFPRPIVENMANHHMAIHRITLPTDRLQWVHMTTPSEFGASVNFFGVKPHASLSYAWYPGYVPHEFSFSASCLSNGNNNQPWLHSTQTVTNLGASVELSNPINMPKWENIGNRAVIENVNRTIARSYLGALWNLEYSQHEYMVDHSLHGQVSTKEIDDQAENSYPYSRELGGSGELIEGVKLGKFNLKPTQTVWNNGSPWGNVAGVILKIDSLDFQIKMAGVDQSLEYTLVLEAPDGTLVRVGTRKMRGDPRNQTWYSDGAPMLVQPSDQNSHHHSLPIEPFQTFYKTPWITEADSYGEANATWNLYAKFEGAHSRNAALLASTGSVANPVIEIENAGAIKATLHAFPSYGRLPTVAPTISIDDSNTLKILAQREWLDRSACELAFEPKLATLLGFNTNTNMFDQTPTGRFALRPKGEYMALVDGIQPSQIVALPNAGTGYGKTVLSNIKVIEVSTQSVSIEPELQASSLVGQDTLMTFVVTKESLQSDKLIYDYDGPDIQARKFAFANSGPLERMRLLVFLVYTDGTRIPFPIGLGDAAEILLQFKPTSWRYR